jgi:hypothetical protein
MPASLCRGGDISNVVAVNDTTGRQAQTHPMFFTTPSSKEHTMKRIATTVAVVAFAALMLTSIASAAYGRKSHANLRPAAHATLRPAKAAARAPQKAASRAPQKAAQRWLLRVGQNRAAY